MSQHPPAKPFAPLPADREPTRAALHAYAHGATALSRIHGIGHPQWWHVSLKLRPGALATDPVPLPGGDVLEVRLDVHRHDVVMVTGAAEVASFSMRDGASGTEMADGIIAVGAELGLEGSYDRTRFESEDPHSYDPAHAAVVMAAFTDAARVFAFHNASLQGTTSPIQLWPHNFDLATEWFGTKMVVHDGRPLPTQLNLGFYPRDRAYFYSNPWPFDESLLGAPLPHGAAWHTEGWQGTVLYHDQIAGDPEAPAKLAAYARAVFDLAAPTL
jgi:hypothetical protein